MPSIMAPALHAINQTLPGGSCCCRRSLDRLHAIERWRALPEQPDEVAMTDQTSPRPDGGALLAPGGTPPPDPPEALQDLRVTELGQLLAGPFCGQLLGDFGAEVIKVEDPGQGDPMRQWGREKPHGKSLWWPVVARNKLSATCNLRSPEGQELLRRLLRHADVLVENFRPGTLERWGLSPEALWQDNPGLVITRVTGYGQTGPSAPRAGFGAIGEAMGGIRYVMGSPGEPPVWAGISIGDALAATFAYLGNSAALLYWERSCLRQTVHSAISEAVLAMMESLLPEWADAGYQWEPTSTYLQTLATSNGHPSDDGDL